MNKKLEPILKEMCKRVNVKYSDVDFTTSDWYTKHSWTEEEEDDFKVWLSEWIKNNKKDAKLLWSSHRFTKKNRQGMAAGFAFNYGWKYKKLEEKQ